MIILFIVTLLLSALWLYKDYHTVSSHYFTLMMNGNYLTRDDILKMSGSIYVRVEEEISEGLLKVHYYQKCLELN